ncbi:MAG: tail fiber domain-containing protein [Bacteroidales bacterium]|nr:tail fiber domain-containing protein [Bacteroidales bacterium]
MKNLFLSFILVSCAILVSRAQVSVNTDNSDPDPAAMLDVKSADKGVLIPRVALVSTTDPISTSKPNGLLVWNTSIIGNYPAPGFYYWDGSDWVKISTGSGASGSYEIVDSDNDTRITVEYTTDEDTIRFFVAGTEVMKHDGKTLHITNNSHSVFIGNSAGVNNNNGYDSYNTFVGDSSGYSNNNGVFNSFYGAKSGTNTTWGSSNTFVGGRSGQYNTEGSQNSFFGVNAGRTNTTGDYNSFFGYNSGSKNIDGAGNTFVGQYSGFENTTGINNTFIGRSSGYGNTSGSFNTIIGLDCARHHESGDENIFIGTRSGYLNASGSKNVFLGSYAGYNEASSNKLYIENSDADSLDALIYGDFLNDKLVLNADVGIGTIDPTAELEVNGDIKANNFIGNMQVGEISDIDTDTRITVEYTPDEDTIRFFVAGNEVMKHDGKTLHMTDPYNNVFIGNKSGEANIDGEFNIALGGEALKDNTTGDSNIAIGGEALEQNGAGNGNIAIGNRALFKNDNGFGNTAIGSQAGYQNISGDNNVFLGKMAGYNETGDKKLYIENSAAVPEDALIYGDFDLDQLTFNGKVGVNTTAPATELDVDGEIRNSNLAGGGNRLVQADGNGILKSLTLPDSVSIDSYPENLDCAPGYSGPINKIFIRDTIIYAVSSQGNLICNFDIKDPSNIDRKGWSAVDLVNPTSIFIEGDYAYVTSSYNSKLVIYDISNGYGFVHVTSTGISLPYDVYVIDDYAYVVSGNHRLSIFDVADPSAPVAMGYSSDGLSVPQAVWVHGNRAYVSSTGNDKLVIFDVTDKSSPSKLGEIGTGLDYPQELCIDGDYAYVASRDTESIVIFNVSDPANPAHVSEFSDGINYPTGIYKDNNYIYVSCSSEGFIVIDVSDVNNPKKIAGFTNEPYSMYSWDVVYQSGIIYSTNQSLLCSYSLFGAGSYPVIGLDGSISWNQLENASLWQINDTTNEIYYNEGNVGIGLNDPSYSLHVDGTIKSENNILSEGYVRADDFIHTVSYLESDALEGNSDRLLSANYNGKIEAITVPDSVFFDSNPEFIDSYGTGGTASELIIRGNIAYALTYNTPGYLETFDISDPENIVFLDQINTNLFSAQSTCIEGDYAYIASYSSWGLLIYNISDPSNITYVTHINTNLAGTYDVKIANGYAFVACKGNSSLVIFDVSDPANPVFMGSSSDGLVQPENLQVNSTGTFAYISSAGNSKLVIFNTADKNNPVKLGEIATGLNYPQELFVKSGYAYVTSRNNSTLVIYDIGDAANPAFVADYTEGLAAPSSIDIHGNYAFIGNQSGGYTIVNISDPAVPQLALDYNSPQLYDIIGSEEYVYFLSSSSLLIYKISNNSFPTLGPDGNLSWTSMENNQLWEVNDASNEIYYNNGYVGINTDDPTERLDVNGEARIRTISLNNAYDDVLVRNPDGIIYRRDASTISNWTLNGSDLYNKNSGNLGLGNVSPTHKLDVNGQTRIRTLNLDNTLDSIVVADGNGVLFSRAASTLGDDLGNHTATQNLLTNGNWISNDGDDEGLFVNSNGSVGLGTPSPSGRLHIYENHSTNYTATRIENAAASGQGGAQFEIKTDGNQFNLGVGGSANSSLASKFYIYQQSAGPRMVIDGSGNVGIGATSPASKLSNDATLCSDGTKSTSTDGINWRINNGGYALGIENIATGGSGLLVDAGNYSGTGATVAHFVSNNNSIMYIGENGNVGIGTTSPSQRLTVYNGTTTGTYTTTGWIHSSDARLKTNITPVDHALEKVKQLDGVYYQWKDGPGEKQIGLIAQEVEKVLPEVVCKDNEGYYGLSYGSMVPLLIEAVKEQQSQLDKMESENTALKEQLADLAKRMETMENK